jgi:hydroxypyruvate isomerase
MTRRTFFPLIAGATAASVAALAEESKPPVAFLEKPKHGRIKQSVCASVFGKGMAFEDQCRMAADLGIQGFDLQPPERWSTMKKYGLVSSMTPGAGGTIKEALNRRENHEALEKLMRNMIDKCAEFGSPNLITFSGNRNGMADAEAIDNCVAFLNRLKAQAEDKNVNICMELLNSRVNHPDYQCDHVDWGVEVCKRVNSPRVKLLFDIYHMQIMDGDIVRRIRDSMQWLSHFHTGGVPGRHEIDNNSQELNYHFVAQAIADLGFQGFVGHEYSPVRDPKTSLQQAIEIFTV